MNRSAWFRSDDGYRGSHAAAEPDRVSRSGLSWLAVRSEYARLVRDGVPALDGVGWLLFGTGAHGAGWLDRLSRSAWFAGLEPRPVDLEHGVDARGHWPMPDLDSIADEGDLATAAAAVFASAPLPPAWCAAVAVTPRIGTAEIATVLGLVEALRARRDPLGRRLTVVVTIDNEGPSAEALTRRLHDRGAFVIRGSADASGDHLHHYPLRATIQPREGRLICVDLGDFLLTWRPGRGAVLQTLSGNLAAKPGHQGCAVNILFQFDWNAPSFSLEQIDRLASALCEQRLSADGDAVFTTSDRLDGRTGTVDLLVIEEATAPHD